LPACIALICFTFLGAGTFLFPIATLYFILISKLYLTYIFFFYTVNTFVGFFKILNVEQMPRVNIFKSSEKKPLLQDIEAQTPSILDSTKVCHVIVIPNYKEDEELLDRTLSRLGAHSAAKTNYAIVMAMEQNEGEEGLTKFNSLYAKHEKTFLHLIRTCHPANIPNELPGKGSNEAYATQEAKNTLIALGLDINYLVFTISDADILWDEKYFVKLTERFVVSEHRYSRLYAPPVVYYINPDEVPSLVRAMDNSWALGVLENLSGHDYVKMPCSAYSLSVKLAEEIGYWDAGPEGLPEDFHTAIKANIMTRGRARLETIYSPVGLAHVKGSNYFDSLYERYQQALRHLFGVSDVAYTLTHCFKSYEDYPIWKRILLIEKVLKAQVLFPNSLVVSAISLFVVMINNDLFNKHESGVLQFVNMINFFLFVLTVAVVFIYWIKNAYTLRKHRNLRGEKTWSTGEKFRLHFKLLDVILIPVATVFYLIIPMYYSHFKYVFTERLSWHVTKKN
jgi:hypothetical protein